jgi:hypothetical protein
MPAPPIQEEKFMTNRSFAARLVFFGLGAAALAATAMPLQAAGADHGDSHVASNALVQLVRQVTAPYKEPSAAEAAGYALTFGCVSGPDSGAMGLHYVNLPLVLDGQIDPSRPEIVIYEPTPNGGTRLVGADYLVFADEWDKTHTSAPELMGQKFQQFEAPNRFGLPRFYTLHVWAWKANPTGTFVNWHSNISCDAFTGPTQ